METLNSDQEDIFYAGDAIKNDEDDEVSDDDDDDDRNMMSYLSKLSLESSVDDNDYASENEGAIKKKKKKKIDTIRTDEEEMEFDDEVMKLGSNYYGCGGGEIDCGSCGGLFVITRPKGGRRTLCMDMDEVKACNDLGFELEHERMMEIPGASSSSSSRISLSASTLDTSSGGNSPLASWRISSPGDDPRAVKARLKVWAQAVAIVSTSPELKF